MSRQASCHPQRNHHALNMCLPCYHRYCRRKKACLEPVPGLQADRSREPVQPIYQSKQQKTQVHYQDRFLRGVCCYCKTRPIKQGYAKNGSKYRLCAGCLKHSNGGPKRKAS